MNEQWQSPSEIRVVTISPQLGSEGSKIAATLAGRLQWQLMERNIVTQVAGELEMEEEEAALYDEHMYSFADRFLLSMQFSVSDAMGAWGNQYTVPIWPLRQERLYHETLQRVIENIAEAGSAVIVGHGAQAILANRPDALHIKVIAPLAQRVQHVMQCGQKDENSARELIQQKDRDRAHYLRSQHRRNIDDPLLYDLVVNSAFPGLESQVDLICLSLERKARWLAQAS